MMGKHLNYLPFLLLPSPAFPSLYCLVLGSALHIVCSSHVFLASALPLLPPLCVISGLTFPRFTSLFYSFLTHPLPLFLSLLLPRCAVFASASLTSSLFFSVSYIIFPQFPSLYYPSLCSHSLSLFPSLSFLFVLSLPLFLSRLPRLFAVCSVIVPNFLRV